MRNLLLAAALLLSPAAVLAAQAPSVLYDYRGAVLGGVALNASAATRTATVTGLGKKYSRLIWQVDYTYSAATTVTLTCSGSTNEAASYGVKTSTSVSAGAGTVSAYVDTYTTGGASNNLLIEYDVAGLDAFKCVFGGASAGAGDLVTVYATAVVGQ